MLTDLPGRPAEPITRNQQNKELGGKNKKKKIHVINTTEIEKPFVCVY